MGNNDGASLLISCNNSVYISWLYVATNASLLYNVKVEMIALIDDNKAVGIDNVTSKALKILATTFALFLTDIINRGFMQGVFPNALKIS